jgi:hypothetical protein
MRRKPSSRRLEGGQRKGKGGAELGNVAASGRFLARFIGFGVKFCHIYVYGKSKGLMAGP